MDSTYILLQHYWWFLVSLLGALLVFLLFVQGGQSLLFTIGKTEIQQKMLLNSTGRKWEFTFTTLVTFGGAFFASFPLFLFHKLRRSLLGMDADLALLRDTSCILRVSSEKRQPTREKDVSSISYDQWYSRSDLTRNRCSDLL